MDRWIDRWMDGLGTRERREHPRARMIMMMIVIVSEAQEPKAVSK